MSKQMSKITEAFANRSQSYPFISKISQEQVDTFYQHKLNMENKELLVVLENICKKFEFQLANYYALQKDTLFPYLSNLNQPFYSDPDYGDQFEAFLVASSNAKIRKGKEIPGRVWQTMNYEEHENVTALDQRLFPRRSLATDCGFSMCVAVPFNVYGVFKGVIEFFQTANANEFAKKDEVVKQQ